MEENKGNGGNTILLTVIGIATLLVAIVGATFAFFTAQITDGDKGSSIIIQTATLAITYNDGNNLVASGITPGWSSTKTVTITNTTNYPATYTFGWKAGLYNDVQSDELVYMMDCTVEAEAGHNDATLGTTPTGFAYKPVTYATTPTVVKEDLLTNQTINAHNVITCALTFQFKEMNSQQNYNQTKTFYGTLELTADAMSAEN